MVDLTSDVAAGDGAEPSERKLAEAAPLSPNKIPRTGPMASQSSAATSSSTTKNACPTSHSREHVNYTIERTYDKHDSKIAYKRALRGKNWPKVISSCEEGVFSATGEYFAVERAHHLLFSEIVHVRRGKIFNSG